MTKKLVQLLSSIVLSLVITLCLGILSRYVWAIFQFGWQMPGRFLP